MWGVVLFRFVVFFFNDTATTEIYTLSLHDALPIAQYPDHLLAWYLLGQAAMGRSADRKSTTSELQSHLNLVCRLLLEKKKKKDKFIFHIKKKKNKQRYTRQNTSY